MVETGLKQIAIAKYSGYRDQIMINIIKENGAYKAFINGERFPIAAAIIVIDQVGSVSDIDAFIELAECFQVKLSQYQRQTNSNGETYFLA